MDTQDRPASTRRTRVAADLLTNRRGVALIEMALTLPVLILFLFGIVTYGSWIALAHAVQQSANEAARASLSGLTQDERASIARDTAVATMQQTYAVNSQLVSVNVQDDGSTFVVEVTYDASGNPLLSLPLVPLPSTKIARHTVIKLTGL